MNHGPVESHHLFSSEGFGYGVIALVRVRRVVVIPVHALGLAGLRAEDFYRVA